MLNIKMLRIVVYTTLFVVPWVLLCALMETILKTYTVNVAWIMFLGWIAVDLIGCLSRNIVEAMFPEPKESKE